MINTFKKQSYLADMFMLASLFLLFYFLWLGSYPLFIPDEGRYSEVAREMVASGDYVTPRVNGVAFLDKPVLYYWLQAAAIYLFGVKEWALRFFPAIIAVFGCLLTYVSGRRLFDRPTGIISALLLATTPLYFANAHYANLDLEVAVWVSSSLLFLIMAFSLPSFKKTCFLAAYIFASLAFLTKGLLGIVFPALIGGLWLLGTRRLAMLKNMYLPTGILIFLAITLPWYILAQQANPEFLHFFFVTQQVTRFLSAADFNNPTPVWFYVPVVLIGFFPWTMFLGQAIFAACKEKSARIGYVLLWAAVVLGFFSIPHSKTVGYILPIFPALALLVGRYLAVKLQTVQSAKPYLAILLFTILSALLASLLTLAQIEQWIEISSHFSPYLIVISFTLILSAITAILFARHSYFKLFVICVFCNVAFLLTLTQGAPYINQTTSKPLVATLSNLIKPEDEVVNYYKFYQDVPLYLGRQVTLVADWKSPDIIHRDNWVRELWFGMPFQKTDDWLIDETAFWQRFRGNKRVFVFLNENYFDKFKAQKVKYYLIEKYNDILLVSNKPPLIKKPN